MESRPFASIIGHDRACLALDRMATGGRLAHAFLFVGPEHVGKTAVAEAFLRRLLGIAPGTPLEAHPDFITLARLSDEKTGKEKTAISVEQVREACERFSMTSFGGGRKALFIEEADRLNAAAGNALLKTLEEPRGDAVIILRAPSAESVPATVASRCQTIRFHAVPRATIADALRRKGLDREEAESLASASFGAPGIALRLVSDGAFRAEEETAIQSARSLLSASIASRLRVAGELLPKDEANKPVMASRTIDAWERLLRERLLASLDRKDAVPLRRLAEARQALAHNGNPQLALEHILLSF
jgi:DNA polymerase-3 subunit delta'